MVPAPAAALHPDLRVGDGRAAAGRIRAGCAVLCRDGNPLRRQAISFAHLGKLNPISKEHLTDLIAVWQSLIENTSPTLPAMVIGLTESGIIPSFTMHHARLEQGRASQWICTSRVRTSTLMFREPHSHAPVHYLPLEPFSKCVDEIWIVEDEITTGRTLLNLLSVLRRHVVFKRYRVFALLDSRTAASRAAFTAVLERQGLNGCVDAIMTINPSSKIEPNGLRSTDDCRSTAAAAASIPGNASTQIVCGEDLATVLPSVLYDATSRVQQATLSPWRIDGWHVRTRRPLPGKLYLYNQP